MTIFKKPLTDPEVIAHLKAEGKTLIQVETVQYYVIDEPLPGQSLEPLMDEWFVRFRGQSHAYRDGSRVGGADKAITVTVLTQEGRVILLKHAQSATKSK